MTTNETFTTLHFSGQIKAQTNSLSSVKPDVDGLVNYEGPVVDDEKVMPGDEPPSKRQKTGIQNNNNDDERVEEEDEEDPKGPERPQSKAKILNEWKEHCDLNKMISEHDRNEVALVESQAWKRKVFPLMYQSRTLDLKMNWGNGEGSMAHNEKEEWSRMYRILVKFQERFGHTAVPPMWHENPDLALWTQRQRQIYRETIGSEFKFRKPANALEKSQMEQLQSIHFVWDYRNFSWEAHYGNLKRELKAQKSRKVRKGVSPSEPLTLSTDMKEWLQNQVPLLENPYLISKGRQEKLRWLVSTYDKMSK
jgi:hypothetical protein